MNPRRFSVVALALALLLVTGAVQAARVRFVSEASEPFNRRVVAELTSVGFDVEETNDADKPLAEDSVAVVRATTEPARVQVWLVEGPGRVVLATVLERDLTASDDADSTKIAERLRALLQPLAVKKLEPEPMPAAAATPPSPAPTRPAEYDAPPVRAPTQPTTRAFRLDAGGAISSQPGGAAASFVAGLRYTFAHPFAARVFLVFPLVGSTLEQDGASADLNAPLAGLGADLDLLSEDSDLRLGLGAGGGIAWLRASGHAAAPREGRKVDELTGLAFANAALGYRFAGDFSLVAAALLGLAVPRTDIEFGDSRVGSFGRPLAMAALSIGYDL